MLQPAAGYQSDKAGETAQPDKSMSPATRPARILLSQQGTGPLQQGTRTNQTIGVPHVRPALVLQQGTVLNQTLPLNQSTGTNQTIGVPQVRPALVLPQGTVKMTLPLNQRTGTNQTTSMRPQGVIGKRF